MKIINSLKKIFGQIRSDNSGFSITELMVATSIIGLIATMASANFDNALQSARDAQRKANIHQVQTALNIYYDDRGKYPVTLSDLPTTDGWLVMKSDLENNDPKPYMPEVPHDPTNSGIYTFKYWSDGQTFKITYDTEDTKDASPQVAWGL